MKKLLCFALMAVTAISFNACSKDDDGSETGTDDNHIIEFKDPNFLKALLSHIETMNGDPLIIDINGDHQISEKEAGIALEVLVLCSNIGCMEEIRYFTALEYLFCNINQLTSLDLSKNTALRNLECNDNQLTSLDLSNNTALEDLFCNNNQLTSLDLSNNTALEYLICFNNQLTSLDLSKNTALRRLTCDDNQLTILDVSKCKQLVQLRCSGNKNLKSVIVSQYHLEELKSDLDAIVREYGDIITYR